MVGRRWGSITALTLISRHILSHTPKAPPRAGELLSVSEAEGGIVHGTWQLRDAPLSSRLRRDTFPVNGDSFGGVVSGLLLFIATPQSNLRLASSPINGGAFWCGINSYIKPALKGEVGFAQAKAGGVIK